MPDNGVYISELTNTTNVTDDTLFITDDTENTYNIKASDVASYVSGKVLPEAESYSDDNKTAAIAEAKEYTDSVVSNPNLLINGDFQVWQRGTSFEQRATANAYTADRWISGFINDAKTHEIAKDTDGSVKINPNGGYLSFCQVIENVGNLAGQEVTLSVMAKGNGTSGGTSYIQIFLYSGAFNFTNPFASEQNAQISNDNYEKKTITGTIPEGTKSITVRVYVFQTNIINLKYAKLEVGSIATPLSPRPYAEELAMCHRYFLPITGSNPNNGTLGVGLYNSGGYIVLNIPTATTMRTTPSFGGDYSGNKLRLYYTPASYEAVSNVAVLNFSANFITLSLMPAGSSIPTNENRAINVVYASNGHFYLDAEIYS